MSSLGRMHCPRPFNILDIAFEKVSKCEMREWLGRCAKRVKEAERPRFGRLL
jgi:hypothetical protein